MTPREQMIFLLLSASLLEACAKRTSSSDSVAYDKTFGGSIAIDAAGHVTIQGLEMRGTAAAQLDSSSNPFESGESFEYILLSKDFGVNWKNVLNFACGIPHVFTDNQGNFRLASTVAGILSTPDGGISWDSAADVDSSGYDPSGIIFYDVVFDNFSDSYYGLATLHPTYVSAGGRNTMLIYKSRGRSGKWEIASTYQYSAGNEHTYARGIATNAKGEIFVAAEGVTQSTQNGMPLNQFNPIILKSVDFGKTFAIVHDMQKEEPKSRAFSAGIKFDSEGNLYTVHCSGETSDHWQVRRSSNGGATWTLLDDFAGGCPFEFKISAKDEIYAVGSGYEEGKITWQVRKSAKGGVNWSTLEKLLPPADEPEVVSLNPYGVGIGPSGEVYVAGQKQLKSTHPTSSINTDIRLYVRKSTDGGVSWLEVYEGHAE